MMPPLECANFLECENKTVCVAPFDLPHGSNTICFSSHTRKLSHSPCWAAGLLFFFANMAWNAIVCETTDVSGGNSIFPIFQNTWFQAILAKKRKKKRKKRFIYRVRRFYGVCRSCRVRWFDSMCTSPAVRCPRWRAKNLWNAKNSE